MEFDVAHLVILALSGNLNVSVIQAVDARSLYAAPFPYNATLDSITGFFNSAAAPVNCVRMRRHVVSKDFRGSVFVEFPSEEAAKEVGALPNFMT